MQSLAFVFEMLALVQAVQPGMVMLIIVFSQGTVLSTSASQAKII